MTAPLPHRPSFDLHGLSLAVLIVPLAMATDSLWHTALILGLVVISFTLCLLAGRLINATIAVRDSALLVLACGLATCADLLLQAFLFDESQTMSLAAPVLLASTAALVLWNSPERPALTLRDALFAVGAVITIGAAREIVGHGSTLHDLQPVAALTWFPPEMGFFLAALAPGAFIAIGLALAVLNWLRR